MNEAQDGMENAIILENTQENLFPIPDLYPAIVT